MRRVRIRVTGRVQGVFFRETMRRRADALGLAGWVRNVGRDCVEAVIEGDEAAVESALEFARSGPALAQVLRLETAEEPPEGESVPFRVLS